MNAMLAANLAQHILLALAQRSIKCMVTTFILLTIAGRHRLAW